MTIVLILRDFSLCTGRVFRGLYHKRYIYPLHMTHQKKSVEISAFSVPYKGLIPALNGTVYEPDKKIILEGMLLVNEGDEVRTKDDSL